MAASIPMCVAFGQLQPSGPLGGHGPGSFYDPFNKSTSDNPSRIPSTRAAQPSPKESNANAAPAEEAAPLKPGMEVQLLRNEDLLFQNESFRLGKKGESFKVLAYRPEQKRIFVSAKDAGGKEIALSIPEDAVEVMLGISVFPPANGRTFTAQGRRFENARIDSIDQNTVMIAHADGVTALHRGVVPGELFSDYITRESFQSLSVIGRTIINYQTMFPGIRMASTARGRRYLHWEAANGNSVIVDLLMNRPVRARFYYTDPMPNADLNDLLQFHSLGGQWKEVTPLLKHDREWERSDGKVSATLIGDYTLVIQVNGAIIPE